MTDKLIEKLEKKLAQTENERDVLYGISLNLMKENDDLAMEREVVIHTLKRLVGYLILLW